MARIGAAVRHKVHELEIQELGLGLPSLEAREREASPSAPRTDELMHCLLHKVLSSCHLGRPTRVSVLFICRLLSEHIFCWAYVLIASKMITFFIENFT